MAKFATMTASLLARKGEAMPSSVLPSKQPYAWAAREDLHVPAAAPPMPMPTPIAHDHFVHTPQESRPASEPELKSVHDPDKPRRLFVALSHAEHERLAIAAVKKNVSQHQIVHNALEAYFEKLAAQTGCACIAGGACGCGTN